MSFSARALLLVLLLVPIAANELHAQPLFTAPYRHFPTSGRGVYSVAAGSFDHDSIVDLVVTHPHEKNLEFLRGTIRGDFVSSAIVEIANRPRGVAVCDFDRDGVLDVAAGGYDPPSVILLRGLGNGDFAVLPMVPTPTHVDGLLVSDLDADGWPDLVTWSYAGINILLNDGWVGFRAAVPFAGRGGAAVGRLDGDAYPDLVLTGLGWPGSVLVYAGVGDGTFGPARIFPGGCQPFEPPSLVDLDDDGDLEIVVRDGCEAASEDGGIAVFMNDGAGNFSVVRWAGGQGTTVEVTVGDVDGDHHPDLIATSDWDGPALNLLTVYGGGFFHETWSRHVGSYGAGVAVDVDRDGCDDVIQAHGRGVSLFMGSRSRDFGRAPMPVGDEPTGLLATQLDDGPTIDLVLQQPEFNAFTFALGRGDGSFDVVFKGVYVSPIQFAVDDLDLDGHRDLVLSGYGQIDIENGRGDGNFTHGQLLFLSGKVATARLDGDNYPEIVIARADSLLALRNRGDGSFEPWRAWAGGGDLILARDLNADGRADVALRRGNSLVVRLVSDSGNLEGEKSYETGDAITDVQIADLDGDGAPDMEVAHGYSSPPDWLRNHGDGSFGQAQPMNLTRTGRLVFADWDGDGRVDALSFGDIFAISFGLGGGQFGAPVWFGTGGGTIDVAAGDFDADGRPDIAVLNRYYDWDNDRYSLMDVMLNRIEPMTTAVDPSGQESTAQLVIRGPAPNPMRAATRIRLSIGGARTLQARVLDLQGRQVVTLVRGAPVGADEELAWNGRDAHGSRVAPGVYFLEVRTESSSGTRRIVVLE